MKSSLGIVVALALLGPMAVAAQTPWTPGSGAGWRGEGRGPGEMRRSSADMAFAPDRLLAQNGELQLTAHQVSALIAIRDATRHSADAAAEQARRHLDELKVALDAATPDTSTIRTQFLAAHQALGEARLALLVATARAKAILTEAQRAQVLAAHWGPPRHEWDGGPAQLPGM
jgi:Spy/CpxP family protein refolding chaperone